MPLVNNLDTPNRTVGQIMQANGIEVIYLMENDDYALVTHTQSMAIWRTSDHIKAMMAAIELQLSNIRARCYQARGQWLIHASFVG